MKVDSSTKVTSLNADKLDGNDSSAFLGVDDQAASATNADEVDNKDANELVRVASFTGHSPLADGTNGTQVATAEINAPSSGFLVINASSDFRNQDLTSGGQRPSHVLYQGSTTRRHPVHERHPGIQRDHERQPGTGLLDQFGGASSSPATTPSISKWRGPSRYRLPTRPSLSAMYVPFDGNGAQPFVVPTRLFDLSMPESKGQTKSSEKGTVSRW